MPANFTLTFNYTMKYVQSDLLYFGLNLLLGCREFPLRFASATGGGDDISPKSTKTFNFSAINKDITFTDTNIFDPSGKNEITRQMLFSDPSNSDQWTFRMGSVALKQVIEFSPTSSNINDFFNDQYIEISNANLAITITGDSPFSLVAKPNTVKLGKQHGEILVFSWI